jgi:DNA polymerase-3 subunit alpha
MSTHCPLHVHSHYSQLDGVSTPLEIAQRCQEIGVGGAGITDHGVVAGHMEFDRVMRLNGLKPIFGMEAYHGLTPGKPEASAKTPGGKKTATRDQNHFIVLAGSDEGLRNVWRLSDKAAENSHFVPRMTWETMKTYSEGVYATSSCIQGVLAASIRNKVDYDPYDALNQYLDIYGERFFIEIHCYPGEEHEELNWNLVNIASERGIGLVYATDSHFAFPSQYALHDLYVCMQTGDVIWTDPEDRKMWHPMALYIKDEKEIRESLAYLPESAVDEALANSALIADACNATLPGIRPHLPVFIPSTCPYTTEEQKEMTSEELFLDLIAKGIVYRYGEDCTPEIWDRAAYEAGVFIEAGLEHYFLYNWDIAMMCDDKGIMRGPGRGSAPGAITAYALGITDICPIHYGLFFERFWNAGRAKGFPDIDSDFARKNRSKIRQYSEMRLGIDKVYSIGTVTRMKPKTALERTAKAFALKGAEVDAMKRIVDQVPDINILDVDSIGWDQETDPGVFQGINDDGTLRFQTKEHYVMEAVGDEIIEWVNKQPESRHDILWEWLDAVSNLCSRISGYGVHPSGVVLSDDTLSDWAPAMWNSNGKIKVTQFPMDLIDKLQLLKNDYLGLRNLDTLEEWEMRVAKQGIKINWSGLEREEYPEEMWKLPERGYTMGLFQVEDHFGARKLCKDIKIRCVEDCSLVVGLNNPGPQRSGAAEAYVRRRNGLEDPAAEHPILDDILEETLGVIIYQEQIIKFALKLGYTPGDADAVRKMLGKKDPQAMRDFKNGEGVWKGKGYFQSTDAAGVPRAVAESLIEKISLFALYSFNKCAHAKTYVHLPDGTRMHISKAFKEKPEEIMAMWPDGKIRPHKVKEIVKTGIKPMVEVKTSKEHVFRGTSEHRLLTTSGYMPIADMEIGTELITSGRTDIVPITDRQRHARKKNMTVLAQRPERKNWDQGASVRMKKWQSERGYDAQVAHIKKVHENHPEIVENLRVVQTLAVERVKWLHQNDPEWRKEFIEKSVANTRATYDTGPGYGHCSIASNGMWCASNPERDMCEWLISQDIEFEMHKVLANGRVCDFYFDGTYWEMDGMDRVPDYFAKKYAGGLPYVVVTPEDFKFKVEHHLQGSHSENGDPIVSITPIVDSMSYDIEMDPDGPLNWMAGSVVSHNSHSMAYGTMFFRTLFAKYYGPAEFYISCIKTINDTTDGSKDPHAVEKTAMLISEARRKGIAVRPPDIMMSQPDIEVGPDKQIYFGFTNIKGIAAKTAKQIIALRDEVGDIIRTPEGYADTMDDLQLSWETEKKESKKEGMDFNMKSPRSRLNTGKDALLYQVGCFSQYEDSVLTDAQRQMAERELLGVVLTDTSGPIYARHADLLDTCDDWQEFVEDPEVDRSRLPATITGIRKTKVRKTGEEMAILTLEYGGWSTEFAVFSQKWKAYKALLSEYQTGIFDVRKNDRGMSVEKVKLLK